MDEKLLGVGIVGIWGAVLAFRIFAINQSTVTETETEAVVRYVEVETETAEQPKPSVAKKVGVKKKKKHVVKKKPVKKERYKITAYCPCRSCSEGYGRHTATGRLAKEGRTIAVDPRVIPYHSKVVIDGHEYTAEDCGGGVKGKHIDMYFDSHREVNKYGVRYKKVEVKRR